ncbi:MAG TPA: hypothetical protein VFQ37_12215 [Mycobacterium sp.]|nr:hypothetical protein [Mycobacterium sp.]
MNRFDTRLRRPLSATPGLMAAGLAAAAALAGCGTGQVAQTTDQSSAVNGTEGVVGHLALRDVRMQAVQSGDSVQPGRTVDLVFVASNQSTDTDDELTGISTDIGKVSVAGSKQLPAGGMLIVSAPTGPGAVSAATLKELRGAEDADIATAAVTLDKPISNGLTYDFTFDFKEAGPISLAVPVSAGVAPHR